jgi:hypothetical protein
MVGRLHDPETLAAIEHAIAALPGVTTARAVAGYDREIDELHVLAEPSVAPKQLVRDLQTLLLTMFDLPLDHRVVSIVNLPSLPGDGVPVVRRQRLTLREIAVVSTTVARRIAVTIADHAGLSNLGESDAPLPAPHRRLACARATTAAVAAWLPDSIDVDVVDVQRVDGALASVVMVVLVWTDRARGSTTMSGSAVVGDDEDIAVSRATLDALNRQLERL